MGGSKSAWANGEEWKLNFVLEWGEEIKFDDQLENKGADIVKSENIVNMKGDIVNIKDGENLMIIGAYNTYMLGNRIFMGDDAI